MKERLIRVCHLSSLHVARDTRIFYKSCRSLAGHYEVTLIAVHDREEHVEGVHIIPFRRLKNRYWEMLTASLRMFPKALRARASIYHFHDPELIPCGLWLRLLGRKVVFDVHEHFAADIYDKPWIRRKKLLARIYSFWEKRAAARFELILAERSYAPHYAALGARYTVILNYPDVPFLKQYRVMSERPEHNLFYIGILLESRGLLQIAEALWLLKQKGRVFHFHCVGALYSGLAQKLESLPFYGAIREQMHFYGRMDLPEGYSLSREMGIGLCVIRRMKNSEWSYPTKIFEYMSVGLPLITSDFELYKSVVERHACGLCIQPEDAEALARSITQMAENPDLRLQMAENGVKAVEKYYSWASQETKLLELYRRLSLS